MKRPSGLGRGLDALIPKSAGPAAGLTEVPTQSIAPGQHQPRLAFDETAHEELVASVREHGILQPLVVVEEPAGSGRYTLIAGERRWRAARAAGLAKVPAVVKNADDRARLEIALVENIQRADLNALEEANAYRQLVDEFGLTQEQVAQRVGRSRVAVTNALRLLRLPDAIKRSLVAGELAEGHARALLMLPNADLQLAVLEQVVSRGLSVRETEALVRRLAEPPAENGKRPKSRSRDEALDAAAHQIQQVLGTRVQILRSRRGGRIVIHFHDDESLNGLYEHLTRGR